MRQSSTPSLATLLTDAIDAGLGRLYTATPGRITAYDRATQKASVQPLIKSAHTSEDGKRVVENLPVIVNVPVMHPRAGGFRITMPVAVGDTVLLVFSSQSLDVWLGRGGETDPRDDRRGSLSDAIAILGLSDFANAIDPGDVPDGAMALGAEGGPTIEIDGSEIRAGGTEPLVTRAEFMAHVHVETGGTTNTPSVSIDGTEFLRG